MLVGGCGKAGGSSGSNSKAAVWAARNTGAARGERQHRAQQQQRLGGRQQGWQQLRHYGGTTLSASKGQSVRVSQLECRRGVGVLRVAAAVTAETAAAQAASAAAAAGRATAGERTGVAMEFRGFQRKRTSQSFVTRSMIAWEFYQ